MKKLTKRLFAVLLSVFVITSLAACGSAQVEVSAVDETTQSYMQEQMSSILTALDAMSDADIESYKKASDSFTVAAVTNYADAKEELGAFKELLSTQVEVEDDNYTVTSEAQFALRKATVTLEVTADTSASSLTPTSITFEAEYSLGETLQRAGLNTLMGVGIVFIVLIFLSFLISLFKYIGKFTGEEKNVKEAPGPVLDRPLNAAPAPVAEETDDLELIAVIAAAIAAAEGTSTDDFVVRSIRKVNKNKWRNA